MINLCAVIGNTLPVKCLVFALVLALVPNAYADTATAQAALKQAEGLAKQNKWAEACPLFEASYNAEAQLAVLLQLADCHERIGRTATAWAEFNDAVGLARSKGDKREADAQKRANALKLRLAKLRLKPPKTEIPGLFVRRGNVDITVLVGGDIPIDPGEHELSASAPGYVEWKHKINVGPTTVTEVEIPALERVVVKPVETAPAISEGTLKIKSEPNAEILVDGLVVGTGSYEGKVKAGGHTVRVTADGMRAYQGELFVGANETRTIDIPLERAVVAAPVVVVAPAEDDNSPSFELAANIAPGFKNRNDKPFVLAMRAEAALRLGRRVNFGFFVEYGQISTGNACGFDMPGPMPETPFDYGPRNQFLWCRYMMPGLQLYVHVRPDSKIDPYVGIAPGFRFGFARWREYSAGVEQGEREEFFPAIVAGVRAGVDYHPRGSSEGWVIGGYFESAITGIGDEAAREYDREGQQFVSFFAGVRTGTAF